MTIITRFAPSPTNHLHLGHIYSAKLARDKAHQEKGKFLLRIEDIDHLRCKPKYTEQILEDLTWLGLTWDGQVRYQSQHLDEYRNVVEQLDEMGVIYPCFCTKKEIREEIARAGSAPHKGEHILYPGTCRYLSDADRGQKIAEGVPFALRIDMGRALTLIDDDLAWREVEKGTIKATPMDLGDVVMARKDIGTTSYHISAVFDDALQGVTDIVRGVDLFYATSAHVVLQKLLAFETPHYHHHKLLIDPKTGHRLAKRDNPMTIKMMRDSGMTPGDIYELVEKYASAAASAGS